MKLYKPQAGETIQAAAEQMILARPLNGSVCATFNDVDLIAGTDDTVDSIVQRYHAESERRHAEYIKSPEYKQRMKEAEEAQRQKDADLEAALVDSPEHMSLRDAEAWKKATDANSDPYGSCCIRYAEKWARLMEGQLAKGRTLEDCADRCSHLADDEGITGFMYGCAVSILSQVWTHGEALRCWHNLKTQIRNEGEQANASGGVLNPALLNIGR